MTRVLYAEDEAELRSAVTALFEKFGFEVDAFASCDELLAEFVVSACDLVVLDIAMPGTNGLGALRRIREVSQVPVIMLTAMDSPQDEVLGLMDGSDDYLTKPFSPSVLIARAKALLRRAEVARGANCQGDIAYGNIVLSDKGRRVRVGGADLSVTPTEAALLAFLLRRAEKSVAKEELLREIWGYREVVETRATEIAARRLRNKLIDAGSNVAIQTIWGYGYKATLVS
ncbi:response regulator transcription factor [Adlercreutzia caecimuris]|uniref:Response regulator transcription factor n=1 Tax=Adlercreutzia caecimuris TaxID=671266 RepID=A0A4S4FXP1_9ACTN|nr:response regulator transcription factor [Adlercreutzia caecimuris]THG34765.1 response regulator transcription factor [Adlercreutzia caecimuris]